MNGKRTIWLAGLALGLFVFIEVFEAGRKPAPRESTRDGRLFPSFDPSKVTGIDIRSSNMVLRAVRSEDRWQLTEPSYPARQIGINAFLDSISNLERHGSISAADIGEQPAGRAAFGLDPARAMVGISSGTNRIEFLVGVKTVFEGEIYLQRRGESGIDVTDDSILGMLPGSASDWRHPMLLEDERLSFDRISMRTGTNTIELRVDPGSQLWNMTKPLPVLADFMEVSNLILALRNARINQFVTDDPNVKLEAFSPRSEVVDLVLSKGANAVFRARFAGSPPGDSTQVYAKLWNHTNIVLVSAAFAGQMRRPHSVYRDKRLVSSPPGAVGRVEFSGRRRFVLDQTADGLWRISEPFQALAEPEMVDHFFEDVWRLRIMEFVEDGVADFSEYGLSPPDGRYTFFAKTGSLGGGTSRLLMRVDFSTNRVAEDRLDIVYARRGGEDSVFIIPYGDLMRLPRAAYEFRNKRIWSFEAGEVANVTVRQAGDVKTLERNAQGRWSEDLIANERIEETVHRLGSFRAVSWKAQGAAILGGYGVREPALQIELELEGEADPRVLSFGSMSGEGPYASAILEEGEPVVFVFPAALFQYVVQNLSARSAQTRE